MPTEIKTAAKKKCNPFMLKVMVFSPESGYKFNVDVELKCKQNADQVWVLAFHLYKKIESDFVELVSVEFTAGTPDEEKAVEKISDEGLTRAQTRALRDEVYPAAKTLENGSDPTPEQKEKIKSSMRRVVTL